MNSGKKLCVILFIAAMVLFAHICFAKYSGGTGTANDPYKMAVAADIVSLGANTGDYDANFVLTADINLADYAFTTAVIAPDTNNSNLTFDGTAFTGVFDGNSHTISNLTIDASGTGNDFLGLFGFVGLSGKIENLQLKNFSITGGNGSMFIGGLAGEIAGNISKCFSASNVTGGNNSLYVGGLVGVEISNGNIIDSYSAGTVTGGNDANYIGGLAGGIYGTGDINGCFSISDVTDGNIGSYIGGLVGENFFGLVANCFSAGTVTNQDNYFNLGGLVGRNFLGSIENSYSASEVFVGVYKADLGGLSGNNNSGTIFSSYFLDVTGLNNSIGKPLTVAKMKQQASFVGWDFNSVWQIAEGLSYPKLVWQNDCEVQSAPSAVSASDGTYTENVRVTWSSVSKAADYEVWRSTSNSSGSASKLGDYNSPFDDYSVVPGATYYYWVKAKNGCGTSAFSSSDSGYACVVPSAPAGVSASDGTYTNKVRVTWSSVSGATAYEVWRNTSNSPSSASKLGDYTSPFDDSSVTLGTTYYYWVKAKNSCTTGDFSSSDSGYAYSCVVPSAPSNVSASDGTYTDKVRVTWSSASGATAYEVWRNTTNSSSSASKLGNYTSPFDDSSVTPGTAYYYWVKAGNSCGTSTFSSLDSGYAYTAPPCVAPSVPTSVSASDGTYEDKVRVTWGAVSGATAYEVWRNTSNNSGSASKLGDYTSPFDDSGVSLGTTYYYWVKAKNSCGTSDFSSSNSGYVSVHPTTYSMSVTKCAVTAGSKDNTDKISFTGLMSATADDFNNADDLTVTITGADMDVPYVKTFYINSTTFKKGKFKSTITNKPSKATLSFDTKKTAVSFSASNIDLTGLSCPVDIEIAIKKSMWTASVSETIVNAAKPIPIILLMNVNDSLRVDKSKFTRNKTTTNITQFTVSGGFSVENPGADDLVTHPLDVNVGSTTFTIPVASFKNTNGKYTCSKVVLSGGQIAAATFDFNKGTFTLAIKNTNFAATGTVAFKMAFGDFNESKSVSVP